MKTSWWILCLFLYSAHVKTIYSDDGDIPSCSSQIYCNGTLLDTVQRAHVFSDSKTFVDMNLKDSQENVLLAFDIMMSQGNVTKAKVKKFVEENFAGPGEEFEIWQPSDYVRNPQFLKNITDKHLQDFGWNMCKLWKDLGRKIKYDVKLRQDRYSLIYIPNPFIVPGGRFRETYYWDSYWVIRGLLICEMNTTVKGMLENFFEQINQLGHVPNGGRIYYSLRSQPPFLIPMVNEYYEQTNDLEFIRNNITILEKEYSFWMTNRTITVWKNGQQYTLNRYGPINNQPRPESYSEDVQTAHGLSPEAARKLHMNLAAAAESGWDFSSRWFSREEGQNLTLQTTKTRDIVPVDLNSILCMNERLLAKFYKLLGETAKEDEFMSKLNYRTEAVNNVLWNQDRGIWQDYYLSKNMSRDYFFPSNVFPMFTNCLDGNAVRKRQQEQSTVDYLKKHKVLQFIGGVPTSLDNTGQQWDFTNGWPPLQHVMIWALENSVLTESKQLAEQLAQKWIDSNWKGWIRTRNMFEKYDVSNPGSRGGGGEYDVQEGFGWTNGVVLDILKKYGNRLSVIDTSASQCSTPRTSYSSIKNGICPAGCKPYTNKGNNARHSYKTFVLTIVSVLILIVNNE